MVSGGNTEDGLDVSYDDGNNQFDFALDAQTDATLKGSGRDTDKLGISPHELTKIDEAFDLCLLYTSPSPRD